MPTLLFSACAPKLFLKIRSKGWLLPFLALRETRSSPPMRKKRFELRISLVSRAITKTFGLMWKSCAKSPKC